jgi:Ppx/GppA phosphatase family protein
MRIVKVMIIGALFFLADVLGAQTRFYGAVDLGSKGVKATLYSFVHEADGDAPFPLLDKIINTKLVSSMKDARYTPEGIQDAVDATRSLIEQMQAKAKEKKLDSVRYYIVGSSGVAKGENKDELAAAVKKATGIEMDFIDARKEGYLGLASSVPWDHRSTAIYVDIGSGNTKLGCVVGEPDLANFRSAEIPYGSVSGRNAAAKRNSADMRAGIEQLMHDEVQPAYAKQSMDTPCLKNRKRIYWTGGAAWATATFMHPRLVGRLYVPITRRDLERFLAQLGDGTWNQRDFVFPKGTQKSLRTKAEKERNDVMNVFVAEDLLSGVSIMKTVLDASNPSAEIRFARNANYTYGYAQEKYKEDLTTSFFDDCCASMGNRASECRAWKARQGVRDHCASK